MCRTGGNGRCRTQGVTYEIECKTCGDKYIGETGRNAYTRGKEHLKNAEPDKNVKSVLKTHSIEKHDSILQEFRMNVTGVFSQDPMLRQIVEAVRIKKEGQIAMNSKLEWNTARVPRAKIEPL